MITVCKKSQNILNQIKTIQNEVTAMEVLYNCLFVGIGGAIGSVTRYLTGLIPIKSQNSFPLTTLIINVLGAFCIGIIVAIAGRAKGFDPKLLLLLKVGFCGGFTTFSTFSLETVGLLQKGSYFTAGIYMALSFVLCIFAILLAQVIVK